MIGQLRHVCSLVILSTTVFSFSTVNASDNTQPNQVILHDKGVTLSPCHAEDVVEVHPDRGCIYLGILQDETGPFQAVSAFATAGIKAFWTQVNSEGGISVPNYDKAFDVAIPDSLTLDGGYGDPGLTATALSEFSENAAAIASTLSFFLVDNEFFDLSKAYQEESLLTGVFNWSSKYLFKRYDYGVGLEDSTSYCLDGMNAVDWLVDNENITKIGIVALAGDYGGDYAAGASIAAQNRNVEVAWNINFAFGGPPIDFASYVISNPVDVIFIVGPPFLPIEVALDTTFNAGYTGKYILVGPTYGPFMSFDPGLYPLFANRTFVTLNKTPFDFDSSGHTKMRSHFTPGLPGDELAFHGGWISQYGIKAALERALMKHNLTRASILSSASQLKDVDFDGMELPRSYRYSPDKNAARSSSIGLIDPTGGSEGIDFKSIRYIGETTKDYKLKDACYISPGNMPTD